MEALLFIGLILYIFSSMWVGAGVLVKIEEFGPKKFLVELFSERNLFGKVTIIIIGIICSPGILIYLIFGGFCHGLGWIWSFINKLGMKSDDKEEL